MVPSSNRRAHIQWIPTMGPEANYLFIRKPASRYLEAASEMFHYQEITRWFHASHNAIIKARRDQVCFLKHWCRLVFCDPFFRNGYEPYCCQIFLAVKWQIIDCVLSVANIFVLAIRCQILPGHMRGISQPLPKFQKCFITPNIFVTVANEFGTRFVLIFVKKISQP